MVVKKVEKKKEIYPQKKPGTKNEQTQIDEKEKDDLDPKIETEEIKEVAIYPQKKPLVFKKEVVKKVTKSSILSKKDFDIAKLAFDAIDNKK